MVKSGMLKTLRVHTRRIGDEYEHSYNTICTSVYLTIDTTPINYLEIYPEINCTTSYVCYEDLPDEWNDSIVLWQQ